MALRPLRPIRARPLRVADVEPLGATRVPGLRARTFEPLDLGDDVERPLPLKAARPAPLRAPQIDTVSLEIEP